ALKRTPTHPDRLCGRGHARVSLGQVAEAVTDAEAALRHGPRTGPFLVNVACLYARAAARAEVAARDRLAAAGEPAARYRERALRRCRHRRGVRPARRLRVEQLEDRTLLSGNTLATATPLRFTSFSTAQAAGFLADPRAADLYRVHLGAGDRVSAALAAQTQG